MRNEIKILGTISECEYLLSRNDKTYYTAVIDVERTSKRVDSLCMVTCHPYNKGDRVYVEGEIRSFDDKYSKTNKLKTYISPKITRMARENDEDVNLYHCEGIVVKKPIYCETATGRRLARFIIAVNGTRANYIPCVCWGNDATIDRKVGEPVSIIGRYQSRQYCKNEMLLTAYEVSVRDIYN